MSTAWPKKNERRTEDESLENRGAAAPKEQVEGGSKYSHMSFIFPFSPKKKNNTSIRLTRSRVGRLVNSKEGDIFKK